MALSIGFPLLGWFFGSRVGLIVAVLAVAVWWIAPRPEKLYWPVAVVLVAVTPFAIWAQGLPSTKVVGATFGVHHWVATDLVIAALVIASFAASAELAGDKSERTSLFVPRLAHLISSRISVWTKSGQPDRIRSGSEEMTTPPRPELP